MNFEWESIWKFFVVLCVCILLVFGCFAAFQDHSVKFYYVSDHGTNNNRAGFCIDGYRQWYMNDTGVFCSDDIQKTISTMKAMNEQLMLVRGK